MSVCRTCARRSRTSNQRLRSTSKRWKIWCRCVHVQRRVMNFGMRDPKESSSQTSQTQTISPRCCKFHNCNWDFLMLECLHAWVLAFPCLVWSWYASLCEVHSKPNFKKLLAANASGVEFMKDCYPMFLQLWVCCNQFILPHISGFSTDRGDSDVTFCFRPVDFRS